MLPFPLPGRSGFGVVRVHGIADGRGRVDGCGDGVRGDVSGRHGLARRADGGASRIVLFHGSGGGMGIE